MAAWWHLWAHVTCMLNRLGSQKLKSCIGFVKTWKINRILRKIFSQLLQLRNKATAELKGEKGQGRVSLGGEI